MGDWIPYFYQEQVRDFLLQGRSVVLQAPTGAGKTAAALLPFLHARQNLSPEQFPRKCIYSVPMRVLANQFHQEYDKIVEREGWQRQLNVTIQTGDRPDDRKLEGDLIFTTIDQTLSNFLNIPYALGTGSANLNAGAIVSSYLVFDELHLYDPDTMLPTALEMLRMLKNVAPFVVMTATFSSSMLDDLARLLDAEVVPQDQQARSRLETIGAQVGKQRLFYAVDEPLTAVQVLAHRGRRTICICNTIRAAQTLFQELKKLLKSQGDVETEICLIHSRFYKDDRDRKEKWIREQFGYSQKEYAGPPLILVATQVIEVGVDATSDIMHTELAPAAALLQRAGRCARREHETGVVYVYLPRDDEGNPDYTPYFLQSQSRQTDRGRRLCEATWEALLDQEFAGRHMSFSLEQRLIDRVHTPIDREILEGIADTWLSHRDKMLRAMQSQERGLAPELIRESESRFLFIHPEPDQDDRLLRNPWAYDGFSFYPGTLAKAFQELSSRADTEAPWLMQTAQALGRTDEETPARQPTEYRWYSLMESKEVFSSAVVAIHPSQVSYDTELGFRFEPSDGDFEPRRRPFRQQAASYSYHRETYAEHVAGLFRAYCSGVRDPESDRRWLPLRDEMAYVMRRLESEPVFGVPAGTLDEMARALFASHDLGKLNIAWQEWVHRWQRQLGRFYGGRDMSLPRDYMAAHTDFEPTAEQKAAQGRLGKRPNHAGESAAAAAELLWKVSRENQALLYAALTAIARHHNAATDRYQPYKSHPSAPDAFSTALEIVGLSPELTGLVWWEPDGKEDLSGLLVHFDGRGLQEVLLYLILVRVLRLADQRSQLDPGG